AVGVIGMGTLMALDPVIAQAVGARDEPAIVRGLQRGMLLACAITLPTALGFCFVRPLLVAMGQPAELVPGASTFIYLTIPGVLPFFLFIVFRQTLQSLGRIAPIVWVTLGANLLNALLDWVLIYGHLGAPPLGVAGSAIATSISRWALAAALLAAGWSELGPRLRPWLPESGELRALGRMARLGLPIGVQMFFEYGVFGLVGALMGRIGTLAVAGHQIALNLSAVVFMVPQGIGAAAAVLVGRAVGAGDLGEARRAAWSAIVVGAGFMCAAALAFVLAPGFFAGLYTPDSGVLAVATALIVLGGFFAIFDGLQAVCIGVLRGVGDTRAPVVLSLLGYWVIGLPVSLLLGFRLGWGPRGLWWGLVLGLAVTAAVLLARVQRMLRRQLTRVRIDPPGPEPRDG
ncbi:MAG TPA: MATE family efflux transporter, partial [Gemmatimonadales bacterium]|nr:MATE family efflux transporter [Gemmatimonadales bacterium]